MLSKNLLTLDDKGNCNMLTGFCLIDGNCLILKGQFEIVLKSGSHRKTALPSP